MKNQLLEDIDDSQSRVPVRPVRPVHRAEAVASPAPPSPAPQSVAPPSPVPPSPVSPARPRAGVWRTRSAVPPPPMQAAEPQAPLRPPRPAQAQPAIALEPLRAAPAFAPEPGIASGPPFAPEFGSFSSPAPDWARPLPPEPAPWTERWGRKALGWTAGLAAAVALAAGGAWMVRETQVETTLAVVADHSPPPSAAPALAPAGALPDPGPLQPPLKLLPREPVAAAPAAGMPQAGAPVPSAPVAPDPVTEPVAEKEVAEKVAPPPAVKPPVEKPAATKPPEKRVAERRLATAPAKRSPTAAKNPAPKSAPKSAPGPARDPVLARAPTVPVRSAPALEPDPQSPLAETLRLCRAAGYHATACLKRGCEATRYGLVCRG